MVTEPTPKPTDALEELKRIANALEEYTGSPGDFWAELEGVIAQWEKERAELGRIEDKKAAFLEAARAAEGDEDAWASLRYKFRALGLVVESASKKEDAT